MYSLIRAQYHPRRKRSKLRGIRPPEIEAKSMKINQLPLFLRRTLQKRSPVQIMKPVTPTGDSSVMQTLSITGFEVDGEEAFKREIESFTEAFVEILKDELAFLLDHLKEVEAIVSKLAASGLKGLIAGAIAVAVVLAVDVFVALWAPADRIIEDAIGTTTLDLVQLTSVNFPLPLPSEHITPQGITVKVTPLDKIPQQYRERREYISEEEESRYEIVLCYNRVA